MKFSSGIYITGTLALMLAIIGLKAGAVHADEINPGIVSVDDKIEGYTYGEWGAKWWQWVLEIPNKINPLNDVTGERCDDKQEGSVWFLVGLPGDINEANRTCTIPSGKYIHFPIYNGEMTQAELDSPATHAELMKNVILGNKENLLTMTATIDGVPLKNLSHYKTTSPPFNVTLPEDNILGKDAGVTPAAAEGWLITHEPLSKGPHTIEFTYGTERDAANKLIMKEVRYNIQIE